MINSIKKKIKEWKVLNNFRPKWFSILFNPCFIISRHLFKEVKKFSQNYGGNKRILDVGCGTKPYKNLFQRDDYIGIDINGGFHSDSKKTIDKFYNGQNIPYNNNSFDIVISTQVFEHVEYPEKLLKEIFRVLKNGGILFLTMPFVWPEHEIPYDFRRLTRFEHKRILEQNNFKIISIKPTSGAFGTCGQLISSFFTEESSRFIVGRCKIKSKLFNYLFQKIIVLLICCPVQLFFMFLDLIFRKKGITLNYIITAQKMEI